MTFRLPELPVRARIALTIFALAVGVLLLVAFAVFQVFGQQLQALLDATLAQQAAANAQLVIVVQGRPDLRPVDDPGRQRALGEVVLRLYDAAGAVVADGSPAIGTSEEEGRIVKQVLQTSRQLFRTIDLSDDEDYRVVASPVIARGRTVGVLVTGIEQSQVTGPLDRLRLILLAMLPVAAALLGMGAFAIARRALRPVAEMTAAAQRIAAGDMRQRIAGPARPDELGELATTLNDMMHRLAETAERERQFTADAAHELRTPLAAIITALEVTLSRERDRATYQQTLVSVQQQVRRLEILARQLLLLSQLDSRSTTFTMAPIDLDATMRLVIAEFSMQHPDTDVNLDDHGRPLGHCIGDDALLTSAFRNVLNNAAIHGGSGVSIAIDLLQVGGEWVDVRICDDGPGIEPALAPLVFQRFRLGDRARRAGGSGLGLAIVAAIAQAHGGTAQVETGIAGRGVCIALRLPRTEHAVAGGGARRA